MGKTLTQGSPSEWRKEGSQVNGYDFFSLPTAIRRGQVNLVSAAEEHRFLAQGSAVPVGAMPALAEVKTACRATNADRGERFQRGR